MRSFMLVIGLLCSMALPSRAGDEKKPVKAPSLYFKVEILGTLRVTKTVFEPLKLANQPVKANIELSNVSMSLYFGEDKELAALAKELDGKTVLISGELRRAFEKELSGNPNLELGEPRIAVQPPLSKYPRLRFVDYIHVTALKAVGELANGKPKADPNQSTEAASPAKEAAALLKGLVVTGSLKQVIGYFGSEGRPEVGDSFEIDFNKLPQEMMRLTPQIPNHGPHYIPFSAPLRIEQVKQGGKVTGHARTAINLSAIHANNKFLIQVIAEGLEKGSKVKIRIYRDDGFLGSMAEAEGVLK